MAIFAYTACGVPVANKIHDIVKQSKFIIIQYTNRLIDERIKFSL